MHRIAPLSVVALIEEPPLLPSEEHQIPQGFGHVQVEREGPAIDGPTAPRVALTSLQNFLVNRPGNVFTRVKQLIEDVVEETQDPKPGVRFLKEVEVADVSFLSYFYASQAR